MLHGAQTCPAILMYHRVAAPDYDPWRLSVSPANFADQMRVLKATRNVLALDALIAGLRDGSLPPRATAITFDDGYQDNLIEAVPILERFEMAATIFPVMSAIDSGQPFWWDELAELILGNPEPRRLDIATGADRLQVHWGQREPDEGAWHADQPPRTLRQAAYLKAWQSLQALGDVERGVALERIRDQLMTGGADLEPLSGAIPMTRRMLAECLARGVELGGHGCSHVPLPALDDPAAMAEIAGGRAELAEFAGRQAAGFAYPHGEHDGRIRALVRDAGYKFALATREDLVEPRNNDLYALPRIAVGDHGGEELCNRIAALGG